MTKKNQSLGGYYDPYKIEQKDEYYYQDAPLLRPTKIKKILANIGSPIRNRRQAYFKNESWCRPNPCSLNYGNFPYISLILILSNCGIFYILSNQPSSKNLLQQSNFNNVISNKISKYLILNGSKPYTYFTYSLIPSSCYHFVSCLLILILLCVPIELVHGSIRLCLIYFGGIFLASFLYFCLCNDYLQKYLQYKELTCKNVSNIDPLNVFIGGSSGGTYSVIGSWTMNVLVNVDTMSATGFISRLVPILLFLLIDLPISIFAFNIFGPTSCNQTILETTTFNTQVKQILTFLNIQNGHFYFMQILGLTFGCTLGCLLLKNCQEMSRIEKFYTKFFAVIWILIFATLLFAQILPLKLSCHGEFKLLKNFGYSWENTC